MAAVKKAGSAPAAKKASKASTSSKSGGRAAVKKAPAKKAVPAKKAPSRAASKPAAKSPPKKATSVKKAPAKTAAKKTTPAKKAATKAPAKAAVKSSAKASAKPEKKAAPKKPVFDAKFLEEQRLALLKERETYTRQAESLQAEADSLAELREPGDVQFDEESGEGDTLAVERERDLALSARARQEIEEIDRALAKLKDGTYGICEVSGTPIPKARLQAIPHARERVEYKVGGFRH